MSTKCCNGTGHECIVCSSCMNTRIKCNNCVICKNCEDCQNGKCEYCKPK